VAPPPADTGEAELAAAEAESEVGGAPELPELEAPLPQIGDTPVPELDEEAIPPVPEGAIPPVDEAAIPPVSEAVPNQETTAGTASAPDIVGPPPADGQETPNGRRP
jgi:hypothetical protein